MTNKHDLTLNRGEMVMESNTVHNRAPGLQRTLQNLIKNTFPLVQHTSTTLVRGEQTNFVQAFMKNVQG
jgi:hypothetical protein